MPITLEQSLADVRAMLGEASPVLWDDNDLGDWLDEGCTQTSAFTLCYTLRASLTQTDSPEALIAGVREYHFSTAAGGGGLGLTTPIRILTATLGGETLPLWIPDMVATADAQSWRGGTPAYWYQFGGYFGLAPYPDSVFLASYSLDLQYAALAPEWTTGASPLPSGFDELPTYYAAARALLARRRWRDGMVAWQQFMSLALQYREISLRRVTSLKQDVTQPTRHNRADTPPRLRVARDRA